MTRVLNTVLPVLLLTAFVSSATLAPAATLDPGTTIGPGAFLPEFGGVGGEATIRPSNPVFSGTNIGSASVSAEISRDGFVDGVGVVSNVNNVTGNLDVEVLRSTSDGSLAFVYELSAGLFSSFSNFSAEDGFLSSLTLNGFSDFDLGFATLIPENVDVVPLPFPLFELDEVTRSADGDSIFIDIFIDPFGFGQSLTANDLTPLGTFVIFTNTSAFSLDGTGGIELGLNTFGTETIGVSGLPVPVAPVPLPAAGWLFASLLAGIFTIGRARRRSGKFNQV